MPDGDRFEWKFKGKKWKTLYRLMCSGGDTTLLSAVAMRGVAAYIRKHKELRCPQFISALQETLGEPVFAQIPPESALSGHGKLNVRLENLVVEHEYATSAQLAQRAAWRAFTSLESSRDKLSKIEIANQFAAEFAWELVESQCVALGREKIAKKQTRTFEEQMAFEKELREKVAEYGSKLGAQLTAEDLTHMRAPKSPARRKFTEEDLSRPMRIEPESL
jgi:hypothetical protein